MDKSGIIPFNKSFVPHTGWNIGRFGRQIVEWQRGIASLPTDMRFGRKYPLLDKKEVIQARKRVESSPKLFSSLWGKIWSGDRPETECRFVNMKGRAIDANVQITKLANGMKLASQEAYGDGCAVFLYVDVGSGSEDGYLNASASVLHDLAFGDPNTKNSLEEIGCTINTTRSREHIIYSMDVPSQNLDKALQILFGAMKVDNREVLSQDSDSISNEDLVMDGLHRLAFKNSYLGKSLYSDSSGNSNTLNEMEKIKRAHVGRKMTMAASGIPHHVFINMAVRAGFHMIEKGEAEPRKMIDFQSGFTLVESKRMDPFSTIGIAFEGPNWNDRDFFTVCVLQVLLGGGGAFSSGGPGKGMYSRLYRNVLNGHGWVESAHSFANFYSEAGMFGFLGQCEPHRTEDLVQVLLKQLASVAGFNGRRDGLTEEEVNRAKTQFKASWLMGMESRITSAEEIGRQVQVSGHYSEPKSILPKIDSITSDDLRLAARRLLEGWSRTSAHSSFGQPCLVVCGHGILPY